MESSSPTVKAVTRQGAASALTLLFVINLFNYVDRYILVAVESQLRDEFNLTKGQAGLLVPAFLISYMIGAPLLGALADRFSRWMIIGISIAWWSLASGWTGLAGSFAILLTTRIFVGIGEAGYGPAAPSLIADLYSPAKRGTVLSIFYIAIPVGSALGYILGGKIAVMLGWRYAFYAVVIPGLILAGICFLMRDPRTIAANKPANPLRLKDHLAILRIPSFLLNTAAMTAMTFAVGGIAFWLPAYIFEVRGLEFVSSREMLTENLRSEITQSVGVIVLIASLLSTILGGLLGEKLKKRHAGAYFLVSGVGIFLAFPATLGMLMLPFPYAWGAIFFAVFFLFFNTGPANTALANVTSSAVRARAFALNIFVIHAFGDAISPPLLGWIADKTSMTTAMALISLIMVVASILWLIGVKYLGADTEAAIAEDQKNGAATL